MTPAELQAASAGYRRRINHEAWLYGLYVQEALTAVLSAALSKKNQQHYQYPTEPHHELQPMTEEEKKQLVENEQLKALAFCNQLVRWGKKHFNTDNQK